MPDLAPPPSDPRRVATSAAIVLAMVAAAALVYLLLDIILLFFIAIIVATALRPIHEKLSTYGIHRGVAVLASYLVLLLVIGLVGLLVGPVLLEQVGTFAQQIPSAYDQFRAWLVDSGAALRWAGHRLPPFESLTHRLTDAAPQWFPTAVGATTAIVSLPLYFVSVLAIAFYWTLQVPRIERLVLSFMPVEQRPRALNIWHDIEGRLGGFMRGQLIAMLAIGLASALGYWLIGLPNVVPLAILAGLLEAVPMIGPILGTVPAALVAMSIGPQTVLLVVAFAIALQIVENNVLVPRIMDETVGVSALLGLFAVLAFGTLYGLVGVLIAIPITAVAQVLFDTMVVNREPVMPRDPLPGEPMWSELEGRVVQLRLQARNRIRTRTSRMGIDPEITDHVVDALDQQIEATATHVKNLISAAAASGDSPSVEAIAPIVDKLQAAAEDGQSVIDQLDAASNGDGRPSDEHPPKMSKTKVEAASRRFHKAAEKIELLVAEAQKQIE